MNLFACTLDYNDLALTDLLFCIDCQCAKCTNPDGKNHFHWPR